jgi:hypothetical protein
MGFSATEPEIVFVRMVPTRQTPKTISVPPRRLTWSQRRSRVLLRERGAGLIEPYGVREESGKRYVIFQVWDSADDLHDLAMYFVVDDRSSEQIVTHVMRTQYNAIGTDRRLSLMSEAGFTATERLDGRFYQPVLVGNRQA